VRDTYQLCSDLLTNTVNQMKLLGAELPSLQYVAPGLTVAYDGDQVTANVLRVFAGSPGAEDATSPQHFAFMSVEMAIVIVRTVPALQDGIAGEAIIPTPDELDDAAQLVLSDVTYLGQAFMNIQDQNLLGTRGMPVSYYVQPDGPEGGVAGTVGHWTMPLL
jgi:hypothetical protein